MSVLIVHPDRILVDELLNQIRRTGLRATPTCRLVAALAYSVQTSPDIIVVGGFDRDRAQSFADLLAGCLPAMVRSMSSWPACDTTLLHRRHADPRLLRRVRAAVAEVHWKREHREAG